MILLSRENILPAPSHLPVQLELVNLLCLTIELTEKWAFVPAEVLVLSALISDSELL